MKGKGLVCAQNEKQQMAASLAHLVADLAGGEVEAGAAEWVLQGAGRRVADEARHKLSQR